MILEGMLLRLRAQEIDDLERGHAWTNDREISYQMGTRYPRSLAEQERRLNEQPPGGYGNGVRLAIDTLDGRHIGSTDFVPADADDRCAGMGIMIGDKGYWSRGYGTDAVLTLLRFGFEQMNLNRIWLHVFEYNERAIACYKKCGFQIEGRLRDHLYQEGRYSDVIEMAILRDEFDAALGGGS
jgi:RimJ/RimL family protein N-acetyltransferase